MSFASWFAITLLAAAPGLSTTEGNAVQPVALAKGAAATSSAQSSSGAPAASAPAARADAPRPKYGSGNRAPDFQYQSYDDLWQNLHNVLEHGDVLLVFGASDLDLRTIERERETLVKGGLIPLAVVEKSDREVWASVRRLGITYSLMADPRGAIGAQYGVYDASLGRSVGSWFMIDRKGKVRSSGIGFPAQSWLALASNAYGRPFGGSTQPAQSR
ncbi:MAG TPA: redoxin domain-containing protein [Methylomirabilota bacterium]|nr:redoxin domain-containing protein [Methylomirabilota bacterium]